jgi:hypothetical protein
MVFPSGPMTGPYDQATSSRPWTIRIPHDRRGRACGPEPQVVFADVSGGQLRITGFALPAKSIKVECGGEVIASRPAHPMEFPVTLLTAPAPLPSATITVTIG